MNVAELSTDELEQLLKEKREKDAAEKRKAKAAYEKERDDFLSKVAHDYSKMSEALSELKKNSISKLHELNEKAHELQNKEVTEDLTQFTVTSSDGKVKAVVERQERVAFNEHAKIAIDKIKEILRKKFSERNKAMYKIIDDILMKNRAGDYDPRLVVKLRKHEEQLNDPEFTLALDELSRSFFTTGTSIYIRVYMVNDKGSWEQIPMQFSRL